MKRGTFKCITASQKQKNSTKSNVVYGNILGKKGSEIIEKNVLRHVLCYHVLILFCPLNR